VVQVQKVLPCWWARSGRGERASAGSRWLAHSKVEGCCAVVFARFEV
jgi:hypothetical protein